MKLSLSAAVAGASSLVTALITTLAPTLAEAGDPLPVEKLTVLSRIPSTGPLVVASDGQRILLADAVTLKWQGVMSYPGWRGQYILPKTGDTAYVTGSYWDRSPNPKRTDVVEFWDIPTASPTGVMIDVPSRLALRGNDKTMIALSSDEKWLFLQNATPATSVSIVDMTAKKFASEIPLPGCFGVYPVMGAANKFVALCGDGTLVTVAVDAKGKGTGVERSPAIFDADEDPLFTTFGRDGDTLYFVSFNGAVYAVDVAGTTAMLKTKYSLVDGVEGGWKPSGQQGLTFLPDAKILYVLMRPNSKDGDHNEPASEVWAVDVAKQKVVSRSTVTNAMGVAYAPLPAPALIMNDREKRTLVRYAIDPGAGYSVRAEKTMEVAVSGRLEVR